MAGPPRRVRIGRSWISNWLESVPTMADSMVWASSRMLPGQEWLRSVSMGLGGREAVRR